MPEKLITAGFFVDYDASRLSLVSFDVYDGSLPGPWDGGMTTETENPSGPCTYMVVVGNLAGTTPDAGGDLPLARVTFECTSPGDAAIEFSVTPGFDTVVGDSAKVYDSEIDPNTVIISQGQGTSTTTSSPTDTTTTTTASSADKDEDGISDGQDNCPDIINAAQADANSNGVIDAGERISSPYMSPAFLKEKCADSGSTTFGDFFLQRDLAILSTWMFDSVPPEVA